MAEKRSREREPEEAVTMELFVAGRRDSFHRLADQIRSDNRRDYTYPGGPPCFASRPEKDAGRHGIWISWEAGGPWPKPSQEP